MTDTQYRSIRSELQVRSGGDGRTIMGVVVPWNAPTRIDDGLVETFARGAFNHQLSTPQRIRLEREHVELGGTLIGAGTLMRDDPAGLYMELRASKTPIGDETLELVKDGALDQLSVAFRERQNRRLAGGVTERVKADLLKVAVVMEGAYGQLAAITGVRSGIAAASATDAELKAQAEEYLLGLPEPKDYDLAVRSIRLGLPF